MYNISNKRKQADWLRACKRAQKRGPLQCKNCQTTWTPILLSKLEKGQYKTTCSLLCTKELQKKIGSNARSKLWQDREKMITISSLAGRKSANLVVKRSKDEIALYDLCKNEFNVVKHNEIIAEGWDADIVIEDLKLAILWNGPWHYKQMPHSNHSLEQVQNRDRIKRKVLTENGYNVISFNDNEYTPLSAFMEIQQMGQKGQDG